MLYFSRFCVCPIILSVLFSFCFALETSVDPDVINKKLVNDLNSSNLIKSNIANIGADFNADEVRLLNLLSERRKEIIAREIEVKRKEEMLKTIEHNLDQKIKELEFLRKKIEKFDCALKEREDEKVKSLVKIYENMNPRRAAQIFDEIELETLIQIVCSMKEIKVSAILANMEISKAKELSVALAKRNTNVLSH